MKSKFVKWGEPAPFEGYLLVKEQDVPACLKRDIKYRGKKVKWQKDWGDIEECESSPVLHIVFKIEE